MLTLTVPQMVHPLSSILAYSFQHFGRYLTNKCFNVIFQCAKLKRAWHRLVETTCHASFKALAFWAKKNWISSHGSAHHSQLRYDSHHLWRSTVQWCHQHINHTKLWLFLEALVAVAMLLADIHSKIDNSAYLRTHCTKNELRRWTQFRRDELS